MSAATSEGVRPLSARLQDHMTLKYIGDCKCGRCQLIPDDLLAEAIDYVKQGELLTAAIKAGRFLATKPPDNSAVEEPSK